jgi:hypothetical protein
VYRDTVNVSRQRTGLPALPDADIHFPENRAAMWFTPFIYLPELPAAARTQLEKMTLDEREQLFEVRCHEAHKAAIADKVKKLNKLFVCFIVLPFMVFAATAILSLERTPYSGRYAWLHSLRIEICANRICPLGGGLSCSRLKKKTPFRNVFADQGGTRP